MKFVIQTTTLTAALTKLSSVVAPKAAIPILANFLIEAVGDQIIITATDLTISMRYYLPAKVTEPGSTTIPAKCFSQLIKELTSSYVEIHTDENNLTQIIANTSRFTLHGMDKREFPSLPDIHEAKKFSISQDLLKDAFYRTSFSVSREDNRYVLTGVHLNIHDEEATLIGTDGKRLSQVKIPVPADSDIDGDYIIPIKAVEEMQKILLQSGDATFYIMADKIAIEANQSLFISKLLTGDYPDLTEVIPTQLEEQVTLHRDELIKLLKQISLFVPEFDQTVRFALSSGELTLSANSNTIGEGCVSMPVNYEGNSIEIAFNPYFFLDILRHSKTETIELGLTDAFIPGIVTESVEPSDDAKAPPSHLFVLMPMRLKDSISHEAKEAVAT